ncbi:hypothetical protein [Ohessyouella blattaphilus]|uniref:Epoxyqueuosine reductase n=1 Tax=Ohessyouella blattaphilus TaxID=2949333 RepID=A0ABT1EJD5_9FIRM|nr:hypothetical protein [Ohessyouella blattaphilus]MCP1110820.1 hypothetical protein [Ohessyouella blattaphilus]MCR8564214.1 hypothetical protein [Ohessyouella blattaphilus]
MGEIESRIVEIIREELANLGRADLYREPLVAFSAADNPKYQGLKAIVGEWHQTPTELFPGAKSVISYFVPFTKAVVDSPKNSAQETPLWGEAYVVINEYFDYINQKVCDYLEGEGYPSQKIQVSYDEKTLRAPWSHRSGAAVAGLGYFSENRMLVTAKGSGGRLGTIMTAAELMPNQEELENKCPYLRDGSCGLCFQICPVKALTPDGFKGLSCQAETDKNGELLEASLGMAGATTCGKCVSICPLSYRM